MQVERLGHEFHGLALKDAGVVFAADGDDPRGKPYAQLRWSRFKHAEAREMFTVVGEHVFPFLRTLGGDDSTYAHHMKDARFTIPTPALLAKVVGTAYPCSDLVLLLSLGMLTLVLTDSVYDYQNLQS